jgi:hypothetical protein
MKAAMAHSFSEEELQSILNPSANVEISRWIEEYFVQLPPDFPLEEIEMLPVAVDEVIQEEPKPVKVAKMTKIQPRTSAKEKILVKVEGKPIE